LKYDIFNFSLIFVVGRLGRAANEQPGAERTNFDWRHEIMLSKSGRRIVQEMRQQRMRIRHDCTMLDGHGSAWDKKVRQQKMGRMH
jgi:hypothetical protein